MIEVRPTRTFKSWIGQLRDRQARDRILARIGRLALGNAGDVKPVGEGVSETRINYGPGYRLYFVQRGGKLIILLCGGDKASQRADIAQAKLMARSMRDDA
jgi:putative addiction module killer protein